MKQRFEEILAECLEAVTTGQRTVEECLALYPDWRDRLEPLLRLGCRLGQAPLPEPDSAFQEAARERFLAAAQGRAEAPRQPWRFLPALPALSRWRWRPVFNLQMGRPAGWRRVAAAMAAAFLIGFVGFSSFAVATAGDSLPGDWRYPVKRLAERTRLTFTFGEDARRDYRIDLAEERLYEVQELASHERQIGESVLRQLVETTEPLVRALEPDSVPSGQIERITDLTAAQQDTLDRVGPLVEDKAVDDLEQARVVSSEGHERAVEALAVALSQEESAREAAGLTTPQAGTPTVQPGTSPTGEPTHGASPTAAATPTAAQGAGTSASGTPTPEPTPASVEATPVPGEPTSLPGESTPGAPSPTATPAAPEGQLTLLPDDTAGGVAWNLLVIGDFSVVVPAEEGGWVVSSPLSTEELGRHLQGLVAVGYLENGRATLAVIVTVADGTARIFVEEGGVSGEIGADQVRDVLSGPKADIVSHILESVTVASH
jgi:hypothetical protein